MQKSRRKEITSFLSRLTEQYINPSNDTRIYWAKEVTFDHATSHSVRVDYMQFKPKNNSVSGIEKGDFYCYEVKSSVEDFHSKNGHNFLGDFNYYVMPMEVFEKVKAEIPYHVGVFVPTNDVPTDLLLMSRTGLTSVKKARRKNRNKPASEMLLMMFRSATRKRKLNEQPATFNMENIIEQIDELSVYYDNDLFSANNEPMILKKEALETLKSAMMPQINVENTDKLKKCPFCGGTIKIVICDDEGNIHNKDYLDILYSGISYGLQHDDNNAEKSCPIANFSCDNSFMGRYLYDTEQEAIEAWNKRKI